MNQETPQQSRMIMKRATVLIFSMMFFISIILLTVTRASSSSLSMGESAPDFTLKDLSGNSHSLSDFRGKPVVLEWTNPGCPFVVAHYKNGNMQALQEKYKEKGVIWLAVNSTNTDHRDYKKPEELKEVFTEWKAGYTAQLMDADGMVGKLYDAKTTPHIYVIDKDGMLVYQGAIDDDRSASGGSNAEVNYVSKALDELLQGKAVTKTLTRPYGCGVKY